MAKLDFANVEIFIVDGDMSARQGVRHILFNAGCRNIRVGDDGKEFIEVLNQYSPDLIVTELRLPDGAATALIRKIRKGELGHNPFVPIILMVAEDEDAKAIRTALDAGIDDVVPKPISNASLMQRINRIIEKRRPYVVTDTYVGPKRAQDEGARTISPPDHFGRKLKGEKIGFLEQEMDVAAAGEDVKGLRLQGIGDEMKGLVDSIAPSLEKGKFDDEIRTNLKRLVMDAMRAQEQLENTRYEHVAQLCKTLGAVAAGLRDTQDNAVDTRRAMLLRPLCQAIQVGFAGGISSEEAARAIVEKIGAGILTS